MESQKITELQRRRWYDDACGTALALELVGERWALLIVRELMFGPRRFGELKVNLPGISANVLTQRLGGLEAARVLCRRKLPSPASVHVYELTAWGYESEPIFQVLGRWAVRSHDHDPTLFMSAASLMLSFRTMFSSVRAAGLRATIGLRLGADMFRATIGSDGLEVVRGDPTGADATLVGEPSAVAGVVYGDAPLDAIGVEGDRELARRFTTLFPLPEKLAL